MKRFLFCCLGMIFALACAHAQTGFTGPVQTDPTVHTGFAGQPVNVTVEQARTYGHGAPVIITGNLVMAIGHNRFTFRDSSGEMTIHIGQREWAFFGSTIGPEDTIEISGEVWHSGWGWGWGGWGWRGGWHPGWNPGPAGSEIHPRFIRRI